MIYLYTYVYIMIVGEVLSLVSKKMRDPRLAMPFDGFASSILREYLFNKRVVIYASSNCGFPNKNM